MKPVSGKKFAKVLGRHGWQLLRIQGSHHIFGKPETDVRLSVPYSQKSESQDRPSKPLDEKCRLKRI